MIVLGLTGLKIVLWMETIEEKLAKRHIRPTAMRNLVLKFLIEQKSAISLSELESKFDKADKVTLYRTLKTFEENKLLHGIDDGTGSIKYAVCIESCQCAPQDLHVHFLCLKCHHTYCLNEIPIPKIDLPASFGIDSINMVVKGVCANCR